MKSRLGYVLLVLLAFSFPLRAQIEPIPNLTIQPIPIPGGDIIVIPGTPGYGLFHQFFPGPTGATPPFDPMNAEPHGITNFHGVTAMGYTSGTAKDNSNNVYTVLTDIRVYQGEYVGAEIDPNIPTANSSGATRSAHAHGTFVEIWLDLWVGDPSLGTFHQVHDFSPWTLPNGLFWIVKVPDSAVQITEDGLTIHLVDVPTVDAFTFPPPPQDVPGISPFQLIPATVSFDITYKKTGNLRRILPASHDPLSPLNWRGKMWDATNSGTFSLTYNDKTFSASGSFDSTGNFGEMGTERNGTFVNHDEGNREDDDDAEANNVQSGSLPVANTQMSQMLASHIAKQHGKSLLLKGRVPIKVAE